MADDNAHAGNVADLLRTAEEDEDVPEDLKERARDRREEIEADLDEDDEPVTDGGTAVVRDDPHTEPLAVTESDGLCLPEPFIGYEGGLVTRMPNGGTIDFKPREWGAHIPNVRPRHFGEVSGGHDHLEVDEVGLKQYGEEEQVYRVAVDGEVPA